MRSGQVCLADPLESSGGVDIASAPSKIGAQILPAVKRLGKARLTLLQDFDRCLQNLRSTLKNTPAGRIRRPCLWFMRRAKRQGTRENQASEIDRGEVDGDEHSARGSRFGGPATSL